MCALNYLSRLTKDQRGVSAVMTGLVLLVLLGFAGLAIDTARAYSTRAALQNALDAAILTGAKNITATGADRNALITATFNANWRPSLLASGTPTVTIGAPDANDQVRISATVELPTILMGLLGINSVSVGTGATAQGERKYIEVALALDNTASMNTLIGGVRRIDAMKVSAKNFVDAIFTDENGVVQENRDDTYISVIPFTSMVNVGNKNTQFIPPNSTDNIFWDFPKNSAARVEEREWRGCVFERSFYAEGTYSGLDMTDDPPNQGNINTLYWPYHVIPQHGRTFLTSCGAVPNLSVPGPPVCYGPQPVVPCPAPLPCFRDGVPVTCSVPPPTTCYGPAPVVPCGGSYSPPTAASPIWTAPLAGTPGGSFLPGAPACPLSPDPARPASQPFGITGTVGYGGAMPSYWSGYHSYDVRSSYFSTNGFTFYSAGYPSSGPMYNDFSPVMKGSGWMPTIPPATSAVFPEMTDTSSYTPARNPNTRNRVCCFNHTGWAPVDTLDFAWIGTGRWVPAWPTTGAVKFGGMGNSGCGLPLLPLQKSRARAIAKIDEMDVVANVNGRIQGYGWSGVGAIPSYGGTIIQQGLAWGWRTLSPSWRGLWKDETGADLSEGGTLPLNYLTPGGVKAVVVMTDGLNFLSDGTARRAHSGGHGKWFGLDGLSVVTNTNDPNVAPYTGIGSSLGLTTNDPWDNSAYGLIGRGVGAPGANTGAGELGHFNFCRLRQVAAADTTTIITGTTTRAMRNQDPLLAQWGCRQYDCMLRNAAGTNCLFSTATSNFGGGSNNPDDALFGPYYDELQRRLIRTCTNMRASTKNIAIYFVLFDVGAHPRKTQLLSDLRTCIGTSGGVYDAADAAALDTAFKNIANQIRALKLTK